MTGDRLIPQFTVRGILVLMTVSVVLILAGGWAVRHAPFAVILVVAAVWLMGAILFMAVISLVANLLAQLSPPRSAASAATPFAGEELPPQWVVPEDPE